MVMPLFLFAALWIFSFCYISPVPPCTRLEKRRASDSSLLVQLCWTNVHHALHKLRHSPTPRFSGGAQVGIWAKVARSFKTIGQAASAFFVIQRPFLSSRTHISVILSEAKDLPSGVRLWKTLQQAQDDKAILSLERCFDKLSMTKQRRQRRKRPANFALKAYRWP